ncbi:glutamate receptor-interacting protein 2-like [Biomphalaria glabrata]|uniref:Glutamate receptor-interacting protein 2-like n=1 Tax=Biomphalaria glabrata TaxID=6526 RepID=A0A9W3A3D7_BIOGL|nr:glutamate receptor-interacting protein 2-like [Biomphalaria glabrata]XP_055881783.1 glutamate receptor-interacting protein 2-like [Biomphalaria glabrata]XP_055881784.1 glutamate receptor-interacting protein 2-like [Biomphalaria glabrata]XP_055881785.1 glutamate receptor-interacting protein 2-like [Biomphalaria glabrata]
MPSWRPNCLRGSIYNDPPHYSITPKHTPETAYPGQDISADRKGTLQIELQKREGCGLGLTLAGGVDKGQRCYVSNLRPGSIAHRCDALLVGDLIVSINGIRTANLRHEETTNLLKNAGTNVTLEIEYELPESGSSNANVYSQVHQITLEKEISGFGITLRGGALVDKIKAHPLTVVAIRQGGPADREGSIQVGDRVLAVNGYKVNHLSLNETLEIFAQCDKAASFTLSYDVTLLESQRTSTNPIMVELERLPGSGIGVTLTKGLHEGKSCMCVNEVQPMSSADRSGALHPGDYILSINNVSVESMSVAEALQKLKSGADNHVRVELVSSSQLDPCHECDKLLKRSSLQSHMLPSTTYTNVPFHQHLRNKSSTIAGYGGDRSSNHFHSFIESNSVPIGASQFGTLSMRKPNLWRHDRRATSCMSIASSSTSVLSANNQVCHTETLEVILFADHKGLGFTLKNVALTTSPLFYPPVVGFVEPRSAAEKSGVIQEGDRILAVNGVDTTDRTLEEVNHFLRESRPRCVLLIEFDVTESVTPSSGVYIVRLGKRSGDTGITISGSLNKQGTKDALYISDVRRGSVAHRTGSIQSGDTLLAINDVRLDTCTPEDAMHLLELPDDIVKLKLRRDDPDEGNEGFIIYTVELQRFGGPLGITISGTEDPLDPIIISELTPHGLADRTGAIHVGDHLLAVSGDSTKNKPLSEAIRMLQSAGDIVTLKIARPDPAIEGSHLQVHPFVGHTNLSPSTPIPSIDSALESWNSSAHDIDSDHASLPPLPKRIALSEKSVHSSSDYGGEEEIHCSIDFHKEINSSSPEVNKETDDDDSNTNMDDWVKTLEELDMNIGSEMLHQIELTLRDKSGNDLDKHSDEHDTSVSSKGNLHTHNNGLPKSKPSGQRVDNSTVAKPAALPPQTSLSKKGPPPPIKPKPKIPAKPKLVLDQKEKTATLSPQLQLQRIKLEKSRAGEDFGFSLSDGLFERGVYISAVRKGSVAEKAGLQPLDRVLQVNRVKTRDFDCCLTVPLIAESDTKVTLVVCRNPNLKSTQINTAIVSTDSLLKTVSQKS